MPLDVTEDRRISRQAMKAEMLDAETELSLAYAWRDNRDERALHRLITAYMRLAISSAAKFKRYGVPMNDLIQEASLGLMKAADKFDPDRGVRFSTYAVWWIKAAMQDYVMRNWSIVRTGSTTSQKSLFFNMRRVEASMQRRADSEGIELDKQQMQELIAQEVGVPLRDVQLMDGRLSGPDMSLDATVAGEDEGRAWIETIADDGEMPSESVERKKDLGVLRNWLTGALSALPERERYIVKERKLKENSRTLESLGTELGLSKERVRQLEAAAFAKLRNKLVANGPAVQEFLT